MEKKGFAKILIYTNNEDILGFHMINPHASILIHKFMIAMANGLNYVGISNPMHIHPPLSEVIITTLQNLREP